MWNPMRNDYLNILSPYAYNILGTVDDAMDVVQDVMMKFQSTGERKLENEMGYLVKSVVNRAITVKSRNKKMNARVWLPEPLATEHADANIKKEEIISYSILVLLEYLNPKERAVFILKEAFDYSHGEIAETLSISVENSRKLLSRARKELQIKHGQLVRSPGLKKSGATLENYIGSIKNGDVESLEKMLSEEIMLMADGGDKINVVREITIGSKAVLDLVMYVYQTYLKEYTFQFRSINHQPAILFYNNGILGNCQVFDIGEDSKINAIYSVVDPDKLKNVESGPLKLLN